MKKIILVFAALIFSQLALADAEISLKETSDIFTWKMSEDYLSIEFTELKNGRKSTAPLDFTSGGERKFSIIPDASSSQKSPIEVLMVVLATGQHSTRIALFVPGQIETNIRSSQTQPIKFVDTRGDFPLTDEYLKTHLKIVKRGDKSVLQIKFKDGDMDLFDF